MNEEIENKIKYLVTKKPNIVYKVDDTVQKYDDILMTLHKYKFTNKLPVKYKKTRIQDIFDFHLTCKIDNLIMVDSINLDNSFIMSKINNKEYYLKIPKIPNDTYSSLIAVYTD